MKRIHVVGFFSGLLVLFVCCTFWFTDIRLRLPNAVFMPKAVSVADIQWYEAALTPGGVHELKDSETPDGSWGLVHIYEQQGFYSGWPLYEKTEADRLVEDTVDECGVYVTESMSTPASKAEDLLGALSDLTGEELLGNCSHGYEVASQALLGFVPAPNTEWSLHYLHDATPIWLNGRLYVVSLTGSLRDLNSESSIWNGQEIFTDPGNIISYFDVVDDERSFVTHIFQDANGVNEVLLYTLDKASGFALITTDVQGLFVDDLHFDPNTALDVQVLVIR